MPNGQSVAGRAICALFVAAALVSSLTQRGQLPLGRKAAAECSATRVIRSGATRSRRKLNRIRPQLRQAHARPRVSSQTSQGLLIIRRRARRVAVSLSPSSSWSFRRSYSPLPHMPSQLVKRIANGGAGLRVSSSAVPPLAAAYRQRQTAENQSLKVSY